MQIRAVGHIPGNDREPAGFVEVLAHPGRSRLLTDRIGGPDIGLNCLFAVYRIDAHLIHPTGPEEIRMDHSAVGSGFEHGKAAKAKGGAEYFTYVSI